MSKKKRYVCDMFRVRVSGDFCVYCGENSQSDEHFPPVSYSWHGYILPCCLECNSLAGNQFPIEFEARCEYVKEKIRHNNKKYLEFPIWDECDMLGMSTEFKRGIRAWESKRRNAKERIAWNVTHYLSYIGKDNDFVEMCVDKSITTEFEKEFLKNLKDCGWEV